MSGVEFVDGPPSSSGDGARRKELREFAAALRENPGRWAIHPLQSNNGAARALASRITTGRTATFAKGFRATSRGKLVYVRYEGDGE